MNLISIYLQLTQVFCDPKIKIIYYVLETKWNTYSETYRVALESITDIWYLGVVM